MANPRLLARVFVFLVAVIFSLVVIGLTGADHVAFGDAPDYIDAATRLVNGASFPERSFALPFFRPPLYPIFIALVWKVFPLSIFAVKCAQALLFGLNALVILKLAELLTSFRGAVASALCFAANPFFVVQTADIQSEPLHILLLTIAVYAVVRVAVAELAARERLLTAIGGGVFFGLAALCRPSALPVACAVFAGLFFIGRDERRAPERLLLTVAATIAMFAAILPWTYANYRRTGEFILINDAGGYALWVGNHPNARRLFEEKFESRDAYNEFSDYLLQTAAEERIAEWEKNGGYASRTLSEREDMWRDDAVATMLREPWPSARLFAHKLWTFWRLWPNPIAYSWSTVVGAGLYFTVLFAFAAAGFVLILRERRKRPAALIFAVVFVVATVVHVAIVSMIRYRLPYVDVFLCVLAGVFAEAVALRLWRSGQFELS